MFSEVELLFGVLRDDKEKCEAALDEDLAEEGILVTKTCPIGYPIQQ